MKKLVNQAGWAFGIFLLMIETAIGSVTVIDRKTHLGTEWKDVESKNLRMEDCHKPYRAWVADCHATLKTNSTKGDFFTHRVETKLPITTCQMSPAEPSSEKVDLWCRSATLKSLQPLAELLATVSKLKYEVVQPQMPKLPTKVEAPKIELIPLKACYYENVLFHAVDDSGSVAKWSSMREAAVCP